MFTGIVEGLGTVIEKIYQGMNMFLRIQTPSVFSTLQINQSIAHNGVCLTIVEVNEGSYSVICIKETLEKTNLEKISIGDKVNLERAIPLSGRLDGHIVQGHIDQEGICIDKEMKSGSYYFRFQYDISQRNITVEKGSICINGVSLTVIDSQNNCFSVAITPYTYLHTTFKYIQLKSVVNIEFDILGKYTQKIFQLGK